MSLRVAALATAALLGTGCSGCRRDHPYVPYTIGPAASAGADAAIESGTPPATVASPADAGAFAAEPAMLAPPGLTRWTVDGATFAAPEGRVFVMAVVRDFDGDGQADAFAVVRPAEGAAPGELVYARGGGPAPLVVFAPPATGGWDAACVPVARLSRVGPRAVLAELGARCPARPTTTPDRWIAVVAAPPAGADAAPSPPSIRLAATIADPQGAPALTVDADASDRDGDGRPDVTLRIMLEGGEAPFEPGPRVAATLAWVDRPAGLSRDAAATDASLAALAASASVRARSAREAPTVPAFVAQARSLWRAICADAGAPRLVGTAGTGPIPCGASRTLEELGLAEARSYATVGDPLRAALAIDRAGRAPAARTAARVSEAQAWVAALAPPATARSVRSVAAVPHSGRGREPGWGALAFEPNGKLLVRTRAGVVRVDPDAGDEADAEGVAAWPAGVTSPDGATRWLEAYDACDGVALRASFESGDDLRDVALPVAPAPGSRCSGSRGAPARVVPLAWGPGGLQALVEGQLVLVASDLSRATSMASPAEAPVQAGSPRSPDGKTLVVPTGAGLLVRGPGKPRLLRSPSIEGGTAEQRECAVSDDGAHVACVHGGKAWVGAWDPSP